MRPGWPRFRNAATSILKTVHHKLVDAAYIELATFFYKNLYRHGCKLKLHWCKEAFTRETVILVFYLEIITK